MKTQKLRLKANRRSRAMTCLHIHKPRHFSCNKPYGFTLIELIIAITLSSVILAILFSALRLAHRSQEKASERQDISQKMRIIADRLTWLIRGAYPYTVRTGEDSTIFFSGSSQGMGFVTSSTDAYSKGPEDAAGLKWVEISTDSQGLKIKENVYFLEDNLHAIGGKEYIFDPDVKGITFEYLDMDKEENAQYWVDKWLSTEKDRLPLAVRIKVVLEYNGKEIEMPTIIARIGGHSSQR